jgi:hypothetical protein
MTVKLDASTSALVLEMKAKFFFKTNAEAVKAMAEDYAEHDREFEKAMEDGGFTPHDAFEYMAWRIARAAIRNPNFPNREEIMTHLHEMVEDRKAAQREEWEKQRQEQLAAKRAAKAQK